MEQAKKAAKIVGPSEGRSLAVVGDSYRTVISGKDTGGAYAVIDMLIPPGGGPGPHAHANFQESFHVLDGEVEIKTEMGTYTASKGTFVNIPQGGMVHCFKNKTQGVARLWCVVVPAGLEAFFEGFASPAPFGEFVPPPPMTPGLQEKLKGLAEQYGIQVCPPEYLG
jgi:quercetin dioxygenase-like cupin family protein